MLTHAMLGVNHLELSKKFYDALLGTLGMAPGVANKRCCFYRSPAGRLCLAYLRNPDGNKICGLHRPAK